MRPPHKLSLCAVLAALAVLCSCRGSKDDSAPKTYEIGTKVEVGHLTYTIFETQWLTQIGAGDSARVPKNRFFLIRFSAVNSGSDETLVPGMILLDDQNNEIEEQSDGTGVSQWVGFVRKVRPADAVSGNVVFDARPRNYRLKISDENGEKTAYVSLPLNLSSETPATPVVGGTPDFTAPAKK